MSGDELMKVDLEVRPDAFLGFRVWLVITAPDGTKTEQKSRHYTFRSDAEEHAKKLKKTMADVKKRRKA